MASFFHVYCPEGVNSKYHLIVFDDSKEAYVGERWHFILSDLKGFGQFQGDKKSFREEDCVLEFVKAEKLEKSN
ncbi:hypothetical protein [Paenibacillus sp. OAS669]|uniref:hypothetical protein n=1 Tax=Paenibacillus sp. OAS669 TaxID=2663821 RepID=UPI00178AD1CB|nr:hypothetical protein [Paenibacillus sp. OAS669]MBE1445302.1 hypothetical protein [Paenibacillus sp. OAS669]